MVGISPSLTNALDFAWHRALYTGCALYPRRNHNTISLFLILFPIRLMLPPTPTPSLHNIPLTQYWYLYKVFSKTKATCLPPHQPWVCVIELLPGSTPLCGKIYPLSIAKTAAIETYIAGFICPSSSPASTSFFFILRKGK